MAYATAGSTPRTLADVEQARLLKITGDHAAGFRDHMIFSVALGTALREHEIVALNVGDVVNAGGGIKRRWPLRTFKGCGRTPRHAVPQEVFVPDALAYKLAKFLRWKIARGESIAPDAPLFVSRQGGRLTTRRIRMLCAEWRDRIGFDWQWSFHALRHTSLTNLYRISRDLRLVQRQARHSQVTTTQIYAGPSDDDLLSATRSARC